MSKAKTKKISRRFVQHGRMATDFLVRLLRGFAWPAVDLSIRLWLAKIFVVFGILELTNSQSAFGLAAYVHAIKFLSPLTAADVGVTIEVLGPVFLVLGFMTRYAAVTLLGLSLAIRFGGEHFDTQLFWAALFGWYAVVGAGPVSIDRLLRHGLANSALFAVPRIVRGSEWIRVNLGPIYVSGLRIWVALALIVAGVLSTTTTLSAITPISEWLPLDVASRVPAGLGLFLGALLLLGLGTRYAGVATIVVLFVDTIIDPRMTDAIYLLMICLIFVLHGGGTLSADRLISILLTKYIPQLDVRDPRLLEGLPRVVIIGAGFGGIACAASLRKAPITVTLVDQTNYHLFQPLLYQVATAGLSPGDIASPVRPLFRNDFGTRVLLGAVTGVDTDRQAVMIGEREIDYDYLVVATGATHSYFGREEWATHAPGLKRIEDAIEIRRRILTAFEHAEATDDAVKRASLLTFLIVGGGPTGVELAGAIAELARFGMDKEFRMFDPAEARVILVQSGPRLLPVFPESLALIAQRSLEKLGVSVLLGSRVEDIDATGVVVSGNKIAASTVLWAAGVKASAAAKWLKADCDKAGRIRVGADLGVPEMRNVFAIGDAALSSGWHGQPVPGLAAAAKQEGAYVARQIRKRVAGHALPSGFKYHHRGNLATIGRKAAVADLGLVKLWGEPAWWLWGMVHLSFLVGTRNRIATLLNWFWAYLTYGAGIRLITGGEYVPEQNV
jgi:NADH dehydrogenase/putative oxidoreductase